MEAFRQPAFGGFVVAPTATDAIPRTTGTAPMLARPRHRRWQRMLSTLLVGCLAPLLLAAEEGTRPPCAADASLLREVTAPFPAGGAIVDLVADSDRPSRVWATDGTQVRLSDDGGCSWLDRFSLDATATALGARIIDLESPLGDSDWLSAFVVEPVANLPGNVRPSVATTRTAGADWFTTSEGLPDTVAMDVPDACDRTCGMVGTTDGDDMLTLWFTEPGGVSVYWTLSGGRNYSPRNTPSTPLAVELRQDVPASEMVIDQPGYFGLFGARPNGATVSDDGGRTWNTWPEHFGDFGQSAFAFPDEARGQATDRTIERYLVAELDPSGQLVATHAKFQDVLEWHVAPAGGVTGTLTGLTSLGDASLLLAATTDGLFVGQQTALDAVRWQLLSEITGQRHVQAAGGLVWMHDDSAVRVIDPDVLPVVLDVPGLPPPPSELDLPPFDPANPIGPLPGTFEGLTDVVRVTPGDALELPVTLDVPPTDPKVDLFFLVARHGSMQDELDSLKDEFFFIIKDLRERDVDVNVGIGVYGSQVRYHRYRDIGFPDDQFKKVVDDIYGAGVPLSAFTAIDAAMLGTVYPVSGDKFATFPGLETHWRPNATRVVLHVTDEVPFGNDDDASAPEAHAALQEVGALHLGLIAGQRGTTNWAPMDNLSAASGALAVNPIDCNGDGVDDLQPGDPIVCEYLAGSTGGLASELPVLGDLSQVIVDALASATAISPLSLHTTTPELVTDFRTVPAVAQVDLLEANVLPAVATVTCTSEQAGTQTTSRLSAASGTRGLATTTFDIVCGTLPVPAPAPEPAPIPVPEPAPVEAPAVVQVQPVPAPAPIPVAQAPVSSNVLPNTGFAGAEQREEQYQSASIGKDEPKGQQEAEGELAFSAVRRSDRDAPITLVLGAAMSLGAAGALARRNQHSRRRVRI